MSYIEKNLLSNEKLIYAVRPHWVVFASGCWAMFFAAVAWIYLSSLDNLSLYSGFTLRDFVAGTLFVIGAYWFLTAYIYYVTSEYGITNKRVLIKVGWIRRTSLELLLDKVEGVLVDQTIAGRIFGYGAITIIGTGGTNDRFPFIPHPLLFRKNVQQQIEQYEENMYGKVKAT